MRAPILVDRNLMYALTQDDRGKLFLEVVVGGIAMENRVLPLSAFEQAEYQSKGKLVLDELAKDVLRDRAKFAGRLI